MFTIAEMRAMLSSQAGYVRWLSSHPCRWYREQQQEYPAEIEQAYWQMVE